MEEKEYYTEEEIMEDIVELEQAMSDLEKLAKLQEKIDELKKK